MSLYHNNETNASKILNKKKNCAKQKYAKLYKSFIAPSRLLNYVTFTTECKNLAILFIVIFRESS